MNSNVCCHHSNLCLWACVFIKLWIYSWKLYPPAQNPRAVTSMYAWRQSPHQLPCVKLFNFSCHCPWWNQCMNIMCVWSGRRWFLHYDRANNCIIPEGIVQIPPFNITETFGCVYEFVALTIAKFILWMYLYMRVKELWLCIFEMLNSFVLTNWICCGTCQPPWGLIWKQHLDWESQYCNLPGHSSQFVDPYIIVHSYMTFALLTLEYLMPTTWGKLWCSMEVFELNLYVWGYFGVQSYMFISNGEAVFKKS